MTPVAGDAVVHRVGARLLDAEFAPNTTYPRASVGAPADGIYRLLCLLSVDADRDRVGRRGESTPTGNELPHDILPMSWSAISLRTFRHGRDRADRAAQFSSESSTRHYPAGAYPAGRTGWFPAFEEEMQSCPHFPACSRAWSPSQRSCTGSPTVPGTAVPARRPLRAPTRSVNTAACVLPRRPIIGRCAIPLTTRLRQTILTALCDRCHHGATFQRLLDRVGCAGMWFILAMAFEERWARPRSDGAASRRRHVARHRPRICSAPERGGGGVPRTGGLATRSAVTGGEVQVDAGRGLSCVRPLRTAERGRAFQAARVVRVHPGSAPPVVLLPVPEPHPVDLVGLLAPGRA